MRHRKMVFKKDQEPAVTELQARVQRLRIDPTIIENSPVEEGQSNGVCEKAVRKVEGMVRIFKLALDKRLG